MIVNVFVIFLIIHVTVDFYLQNDQASDEINYNIKTILVHGLKYSITAIIFIIPFWSLTLFMYSIILSAIHLIIDFIKYSVFQLTKRDSSSKISVFIQRQNQKEAIYAAEQIIRIILIHILSVYYLIQNGLVYFDHIWYLPVSMDQLLKLTLITLLILKPVNITFNKFIKNIKPLENEEKKDGRSIGKLVGNIERLLIVLFFMVNQYAAIGLVFTAKSIARYDKISDNQDFAEYYLLGTLFSMLSALIIYLGVISL